MKKCKLWFELVFIFVLPILLMLPMFNICILIEYDYQSVGTSQLEVVEETETKSIVFDPSVIGFTSDNPIIELFETLENYLSINSSTIYVKAFNIYNALWLLFFVAWHLVYGIAELFVHLFDKKNLDLNR